MSNSRNRYTAAIVLFLVALCVMLSGCSNEDTTTPVYEPARFTSDSYAVVFRAPDAVPFYYWGNFPEGFEPMLEIRWDFPVPYYNDSNEASKKVCAYFQEQGMVEDIDTLLAEAKKAYNSSDDYNARHFYQDTQLTAATDSMWAFNTVITTPYADGYTHLEHSNYFDPATGEPIELWDLFSASKEDVQKKLISYGTGYYDEQLMIDTFDPSFVAFGSKSIMVTYAPGTLMDTSAGYSVEYSDLADILHPWAIPSNAS